MFGDNNDDNNDDNVALTKQMMDKKKKLKEAFNKDYDSAKQSGTGIDEDADEKFFEKKKEEMNQQYQLNKAVCYLLLP